MISRRHIKLVSLLGLGVYWEYPLGDKKMDHAYFCPACFAEIAADDSICPVCGVNIHQWEQEHPSYEDRLINALKHPNSEARMGSIITLGNRGNPKTATPLTEGALTYSIDVWQAMEIVRSLRKLPDSPEKTTALQMLLDHPARVIREEAAATLTQVTRETCS
ncbi:HEAT repeat domain-containing protein [Thermosynechococcus sp. QKsg1]|uniref:HEAT repeat domain-containing protein n=1 Tax=unclassified Thermosynechococcus TaxID=2622553 RepID=UPI001D03EF6E|nr:MULTISPECIES: HEAT repeat domain-containing protein [unclassified Thermosynechococcus]WJI23999.1 HEAT repeat domain-containing protein [Thermosynechococcus sp. B0]WJI26513.1 HEAT repeat domain-containing protein [Thermosynechococcus sp. B1]WJI29039.1 HEAT repeat domain-containing protein [Thermosynechococcus sp. B3]WNC86632.1 HEAT repeat domain-containing protein [Thermosynechococcus sp. QKsg1]